jgi:hypothetical protein
MGNSRAFAQNATRADLIRTSANVDCFVCAQGQYECTEIALISYKDDPGYARSFNLRDDERLIHDGGETADLEAARKEARASTREQASVSD